MKKNGKLIAFCGIDGSGKTTQARLLCNYLEDKNYNVFHLPKMPSFGGWIADCVKMENKTDNSINQDIINVLEASDRIRYLVEYCEKILSQNNTIVISERYTYSYIARAITQKCRPETINALSSLYKACLTPDICFYLSVSAKTAAERVKKRGYDSEDENRLVTLDNAYRSIDAFSEFQVIDAEKSKDRVYKSICDSVNKKIIGGY